MGYSLGRLEPRAYTAGEREIRHPYSAKVEDSIGGKEERVEPTSGVKGWGEKE